MPASHRLLAAAAACGLAATLTAASAARAPLHRYEASRLSMACVYAMELYGRDERALPAIAEAALDEVDRIDRLMSHYKPDSPLSQLNREAASGAVTVDAELFDFIAAAIGYTRRTDGAFDITVGPLMKAWGFFKGDGHRPTTEALAAARRLVGAGSIVMNAAEKSIRFSQPGVELDLGGIAKGYAVDRVVALLRQRRVEAALVSAGGSTIYGLGTPPNAGAWSVDIQDPVDSRKRALRVPLRDRAVSVAGGSEKSFEAGGIRYSHIMDPRTGMPVKDLLTVVVLTTSGTAGDAFDNAFFVLGPKASRPYLDRLTGTDAYFFLPDPKRRWRLVHASSRRSSS
jgi:FAD:protein FMN transferase